MALVRVIEAPGPPFLGLRRRRCVILQEKHWFVTNYRSRAAQPWISQCSSNSLSFSRFFCENSTEKEAKEMSNYQEAFSRRVEMAGIKSHHRIAIGVSGGPDSIALCILTASWKTNHLAGEKKSLACIDGLLGIVIDHRLRPESESEAKHVRDRVSRMGIQCEIACCDWSAGKPKHGHLQEAARNMRYQIFQEVCIQHHANVLLIAHHAGDQAESFILRLSRNSGVLGLAGMAFVSQLFPNHIHNYGQSPSTNGILLVRPLLEFSKDDLYKICRGGKQHWVEDPTNQNPLFARNRIRLSLRDFSSGIFRSELQAIISACRKTRSFVDQICYKLMNQAVTVMNYGYAVVDLQKLDPSSIDDLCLSKFVVLVLQFISQRHRPVRGSISQLLLSYIRSFPCKGSLTAAGCYLCPAPQSKGTKILVCCSPNSPLPASWELSDKYYCEEHQPQSSNEVEQIIADAKSCSDHLVPDASDVPFVHVKSSDSILIEAKKLKILSESTHSTILLLQKEESKHFNAKGKSNSVDDLKHEVKSPNAVLSQPVRSKQSCYFMNRFLVCWKLSNGIIEDGFSGESTDFNWYSKRPRWDCCCRSCVVPNSMEALIRYMEDADWLYLADLSKRQTPDEYQECPISSMDNEEAEKKVMCSNYIRWSAQRALLALKSIPVSARRGLPVLVNSQGLLLSIPSICFKHCPCLSVLAVFKPRVPLGGGYSSYI